MVQHWTVQQPAWMQQAPCTRRNVASNMQQTTEQRNRQHATHRLKQTQRYAMHTAVPLRQRRVYACMRHDAHQRERDGRGAFYREVHAQSAQQARAAEGE